MMENKKTDLWKDNENNEIDPEFTSSTPETARKWRPLILYLKNKSIECTKFDPNSRPSFDNLNEALQSKYDLSF